MEGSGFLRRIIWPHVPLVGAKCEHGFDCENHANLHFGGILRRGVIVGDNQTRVERLANTVAGEIPDNSVAKAFGICLYRPADYVDLTTRSYCGDSSMQLIFSPFHQKAYFLLDVAYQKGLIAISVESVLVGRDIDVHDVTIL
jgi:hypothetical protein